ncbi:MAG: molecular chaperone [uncultured archaeon A07HN63]|nr:MAG: molecular chaperone [uncultured archaeon A07HN63]
MGEGYTVGIDLGTTRSAVAYVAGGDPEVIKTGNSGESVIPSVVQFGEDGAVNVGQTAANMAIQHPDRTVTEVKREMGSEEPLTVAGEEYLPEQISSLILEHIVDEAEASIGRDVEGAVITVPAYFDDPKRTATESAGEIAGLDVKRLLPEPSAACLAYGLHEQKLGNAEAELAFVYDLGGGTFDATLVEIDYEINSVETLHTAGNNSLGGSNWTQRIVDWMVDRIGTDTGVDITNDTEQLARVREEAKSAKHRLSDLQSTEVSVPFVVPEESYTFSEELTRERFEELTADLADSTTEPLDALFERADYEPEDVDKVLLAGGSVRMPHIQDLVSDYFEQEASMEINPEEAVALGAAIQAEIIDEGGADAAAMLPGETDDIVLIDVVPKSLGVRLSDGSIDHIIEQDEQIPTSTRKEGYGTVEPEQTSVQIHVYQGEGNSAEENTKIGRAVLRNIPPRPPGEPSLAVEFRITTDGQLEVTGEDLKTGKQVETAIESALRHSPEEIDELDEQLPALDES